MFEESAPWIGFLAHAAAPAAHHLIEEPHAPLAEHLLHAVALVQRLHRWLHVEQKALTVRCANLSPQKKNRIHYFTNYCKAVRISPQRKNNTHPVIFLIWILLHRRDGPGQDRLYIQRLLDTLPLALTLASSLLLHLLLLLLFGLVLVQNINTAVALLVPQLIIMM